MFERQNDLMRSSQQFIQAKDVMDHENVALKKNLENTTNQLEKLKEELQFKNEQLVALKTKEDLVNTMIEKGTAKNDEEVRRLGEENALLKDRITRLREEYEQLDEQYKAAVSQHEENKNMLESLLTAVKSKMNRKERERTSLVEINKYLNSLIQTQDQKNIDLENKVDSMNRFKQMVKSASMLQCKGCMKSYQTALFTPHVKLCPKLEHNGLRLEVIE
jgi:chromosome segregation ATPase